MNFLQFYSALNILKIEFIVMRKSERTELNLLNIFLSSKIHLLFLEGTRNTLFITKLSSSNKFNIKSLVLFDIKKRRFDVSSIS